MNTRNKKVITDKTPWYRSASREKAKRGRKPRLSDAQICVLYLASTLLAIPILPLVKALGLKASSWHIFRRYRTKRVYQCLRAFLKELNYRTQGRQTIIVDEKLLKAARLSRALTQRIKRGFGGKSWGRRKRKLYSQHLQKQIEVDELVYGLLIMALVDEKAKVVDIWLKPASTHEGKALKERMAKSSYLRQMVKGKELLEDKGYRGIEGLKVALTKEEKSKRQVIEGIFAKVRYLELSDWRQLFNCFGSGFLYFFLISTQCLIFPYFVSFMFYENPPDRGSRIYRLENRP